MAELSLIAPLLVIITIFVTDFGLFLQSYFRAMHIAREGIKTAVAVPNLESSFNNSPSAYSGTYSIVSSPGVISRSPAVMTPNHYAIQKRVRDLLQVENGARRSLQLVSDQVVITSRCIRNSAGGQVQLSVSGRYSPLLPINLIFGSGAGLRFTARAQGDYLFTDCAA